MLQTFALIIQLLVLKTDCLIFIHIQALSLIWMQFPPSVWGFGPPLKSVEPPHTGQHCRLNTSGQINLSHPSNIDFMAHIKGRVLNFKKAAILISDQDSLRPWGAVYFAVVLLFVRNWQQPPVDIFTIAWLGRKHWCSKAYYTIINFLTLGLLGS